MGIRLTISNRKKPPKVSRTKRTPYFTARSESLYGSIGFSRLTSAVSTEEMVVVSVIWLCVAAASDEISHTAWKPSFVSSRVRGRKRPAKSGERHGEESSKWFEVATG